MNRFATKLLVASVAAAVSGAAAAADKAPTLADVLQSSGITATGYIDTTFTSFSTDPDSINYHAYTTEHRSFNLQAADVALSYLPASGFGGMAEVQYGKDVDFNSQIGGSSNANNLLQAYLQYASGPFSLMAGKFTTLAGAEVPQEPANTNISRSLLYTWAIPVWHTGLRANYAPSDAYKFTVGVNNGWNRIQESAGCITANTCPNPNTLELGVAANPSKLFGLTASLYNGQEPSFISGNVGDRTLLDVVATINATDALSFVLNYDNGQQKHATATNDTAKWEGLAGYVNYKMSDTWRLSVRAEEFKDKDCFVTATCTVVPTASEAKIDEATLTVAYMPGAHAEFRGELRHDKADSSVFVKDGSATDKQDFIGLEAIYKF